LTVSFEKECGSFITTAKSKQGWPGDVPQSRMNSTKFRKAGFSLARSSDDAVKFAISQIIEWVKMRGDKGDGLKLPPCCGNK
jgi:hypothetical protein